MSRKFLTPINMGGLEVQNPALQNLATAPSSPTSGQFYYDTSILKMRIWNGAGWDSLTTGVGVTYGSPGSSAVGDSVAAGSSASVSRTDHVHGREGFGAVTAQTAFGAVSASGIATTVSHSDHTHGTPATPTAVGIGAVANSGNVPTMQAAITASRPAAGNSGAIFIDTTTFLISRDNGTGWDQIAPFAVSASTQAIGDSSAPGVANNYSRGDHKHAMSAFGAVTAESTYGGSSANGSAATVARSDHTHGNPALTSATPSTQAIGDAAVVGVGTDPARNDHKHAMPAFGNVTAQTSFGASLTNGSLGTVARSDHNHGTPTHVAADHSTIKISDLAAPTATVSFNGQLITNVATPVSGTDAANKNYVDAAVAGLTWKAAARVGSTANVAIASPGTTIDGITTAANDRVLLFAQITAADNGIYVYNGAATPMTRTTDANTSAGLSGAAIFVKEGTSADMAFTMITDGTITVGTTAMSWTQFTGTGEITAGNGITKTGNTLSVTADTGILVSATGVAIDTAVVARKYATTIGNGTLTSFTITHNLGTQNVVVQVFSAASTYDEVECDVQYSTTNSVTLIFSVAPAASAYRVTVVG